MAGVIAIDASILIALLNDSDTHHAWARRFFTDTLDDDLCMSALTFAEILVHPMKRNVGAEFLESIAGLGLQVRDITGEQAPRLADIRVRSGLKMPDAAVVHLAIETGATLATLDAELAAQAQNLSVPVYPRD